MNADAAGRGTTERSAMSEGGSAPLSIEVRVLLSRKRPVRVPELKAGR